MYSAISKFKIINGLRTRLTLVYSVLYGIFISLFVYYFAQDSIKLYKKDFDIALMNYALDISNSIKIDESNLRPVIRLPRSDLAKKLPFAQSSIFFSVRTVDGKIVFSSLKENMDIPYYPDLGRQVEYTHRYWDVVFSGRAYRAINIKIFTEGGRPMILQLATPSALLEEQSKRIILFSSISVPILIIFSAFLSYFMAGQALKPVSLLTMSANQIAAKNLSKRIPEVKTADEIEELSKTLNNLLDRLEGSFKAQENFVANASHQLNTPLSIIKGELQLLNSKNPGEKEISDFHTSLKVEVDRLIDLVKNMLLISRVEAGIEKFIFNPVRVDEILLNIVSRLTPKAKEKKITIRFDIEEMEEETFLVKGEKQLLDSLFENLLDNAIKYSQESGQIKILLKKVGNQLATTIQDNGQGIPDTLVEKIFSGRFQRGNYTSVPGNGLGLSIARQIAQLHHATINYRSGQPHGAIFEVCFPVGPLNS